MEGKNCVRPAGRPAVMLCHAPVTLQDDDGSSDILRVETPDLHQSTQLTEMSRLVKVPRSDSQYVGHWNIFSGPVGQKIGVTLHFSEKKNLTIFLRK